MIATFITLVKECCEETKAAVNASCVRCEGRVTEGVAFVLEKGFINEFYCCDDSD